MTNFKRKVMLEACKLLDLLIMCLSFVLATVPVYYQDGVASLEHFFSLRIKIEHLILFLGFLYLWPMILSFFLLYRSRRLSNGRGEILDSLKATSLGTGIILAGSLLFQIKLVTPAFLAVFFLSSSGLTILSRLLLQDVFKLMRERGRNLRYMLIVGTNPRALRFARNIEQRPDLGYRILGFVDNEWSGMEEFSQEDFPLIGNFTDFPALLRDHVVDEVVISLPVKSQYEQASRIVALCEEQGTTVRFLSDIFNSKLSRGKSEVFEDEAVVTVYPGAILGWLAMIKRTIDFSLSLVLLLSLSPLFLVTSLLIKLTSQGPVFFIQERVGLNKRRFRLYKFRTMIPDAERKMAAVEHLNEISGPVFKIKDDPRITRVGKILRKLSIDELPQLINVLKGDMSLVGPRPLPVRDYNGFDQDWQRRRFSVLPGITCLWQINGRSNVNFEKWMQLDMQYIDQWSLWLDLKILAKTIPAVLRGSGAA
jgi:exopolysaccharide biosynthesis polyprenyl glycosylphosphotransferase